MCFLWTEKYRPTDISTFESVPHIKNFINVSLPNDYPNLLLYGPPGTGKTTFAHLIASNNKLELNASDERGINVIRDKIKSYAFTLKKDKTVILDECENLTEDAQHCLRRIIEDSNNTRFIFTTNYLSKVILPLKSRLVKIKFKLDRTMTLSKIGKLEGFNLSDEFYNELFIKCQYDLRRSINVLQALFPLINNNKLIDNSIDNNKLIDNSINDNNNNNKLEYNIVNDIIGIIPNDILDEFNNLTNESYIDFINKFIFEGFSVLQFILQLSSYEIFTKEIDKAKFLLLLSELEEKLLNGCSDETVLTKICLFKISIF